MNPEIDIWRAANLMLERYGEKAFKESTALADELAADEQLADNGCEFSYRVVWNIGNDSRAPPAASAARSAIWRWSRSPTPLCGGRAEGLGEPG